MADSSTVKGKFIERRVHVEQLRLSDEFNARVVGEPTEWLGDEEEVLAPGAMPMAELMATIEALGGVILPLIVVALKDRDPQGRELFAVAAGGRRSRALLTLWKAERLADPMIVCREIQQFDPMLISLIENKTREPMHPADECIAFAKLVDKGQGAASVAAAFAVDVRHVHQRLALAKLHPKLLADFRARKFAMDVAKALATEPDQAKQLAVWKKLPGYCRTAHQVRHALTAEDLRSGDRLVRFVGMDAYTAAGGEARDDFFATEGEGSMILTDPGLIETLAAAKLEDKAQALRQQGWKWAEVVPCSGAYDVDRVAHARGLQRFEARGADREKCGYFVYCDHSGNMQVLGPFMPKKEVKAQALKAAEAGGIGVEQAGKGVPESLMTSLTAHKSAALQCALLANPRVALALLAANIVANCGNRFHLGVSFQNQGHRIESQARGYEQTKPAATLATADSVWEGRIPQDADAFAWFLQQPESVALEAIVWGTARSFEIINGRQGCPKGVDVLKEALAFSLADHFRPTVQTYLGHVPKARIISDVADALGAEAAAPLQGLKKDALAATAEAQLVPTGWVPEAIR